MLRPCPANFHAWPDPTRSTPIFRPDLPAIYRDRPTWALKLRTQASGQSLHHSPSSPPARLPALQTDCSPPALQPPSPPAPALSSPPPSSPLQPSSLQPSSPPARQQPSSPPARQRQPSPALQPPALQPSSPPAPALSSPPALQPSSPPAPALSSPPASSPPLGEPEGADVLLTKDKIAEEVEFVARMMLEKKAFDNKDVLYLFEKLEELGDTDFRVGKKSAMTSWFTGAYVHGGVAGLRSNARRFPYVTKYLVEYARARVDGQPFTALGITRNSALGLHRDVHNVRCTKNTVIPVTKFEGGGVWVESSGTNDENQPSRPPALQPLSYPAVLSSSPPLVKWSCAGSRPGKAKRLQVQSPSVSFVLLLTTGTPKPSSPPSPPAPPALSPPTVQPSSPLW